MQMNQSSSLRCREKDGLWAVLAWLSVLAFVNKDQNRNLLEKVAHAAPGEACRTAKRGHDFADACHSQCPLSRLPTVA